ncbi:MAG: shikimate dehydrogenase [Verrucomicrobia bacterium]|nr:shikimate dehydrogenase [Verrucomicrobiota bacterium]MDE3098054.1 shikimate dehydrogenase [Verrucomicrobiota bacterium]
MHNAAFEALGLNWRYLAFEVHPKNLRAAIAGAQAMQFAGINLTVPHKLPAINMMDRLDASAAKWGAVNTIRFEGKRGGAWLPLHEFDPDERPVRIRSHGFNTDADAIVRALMEDLDVPPAGAKVLLLGAGGAGRTAALKLASEGATLFLVNRTAEKALALAREIRRRFPRTRVSAGYPREKVDITINATSLGLKGGDPLPVDLGQFPIKQTRAVYDMIYRPQETRLLRAARQAGCKTANGLGMLLYQGAKAFEIWTGRPAPVEVMQKSLHSALSGGKDK